MNTGKNLLSINAILDAAIDSPILDRFVFLKSALTEFKYTGAFFPTSRAASQKLTRPLDGSRTPKDIVELGAGHGAVTMVAMEKMIPGDTLTLCEINPSLMEELRIRVAAHPRYVELKDSIRFFCCPAQELPTWIKADVILCSLPFLNFELELVRSIFAKITELAKPGCQMTYYEYIGIKRFSKILAPKARRERMKSIDQFFNRVKQSSLVRKQNEWRNAPPIHVYELSSLDQVGRR